jgi:hypothetical protein
MTVEKVCRARCVPRLAGKFGKSRSVSGFSSPWCPLVENRDEWGSLFRSGLCRLQCECVSQPVRSDRNRPTQAETGLEWATRLNVIKTFGVVLICLTAWLRGEAQSMEVIGLRVSLPDGNVLGAAFYEGKGMFFVQQSVLSTENGGLVIRSHRQLSSWNVGNRSMVTKRIFDESPQGASAFPCGRVEISTALHRVFVCSAGSHLELIDPDDLSTVGKMAQVDDQIITDFAVDDPHGRVLVLSARRDGSIHLASYSLQKGERQQEGVLPTANSTRMCMAIVPRTGQIGIAVDVATRPAYKADIYTCSDGPDLACTKVTQIDAVSQISFLGRQLLAATNTFADNKRDCILTVDPMTREVSRQYCSPSTGVHYALGVVNKMYVVGFTGVSKRGWLSEENRSVASSFSVWRAETSQVAAVAKGPDRLWWVSK